MTRGENKTQTATIIVPRQCAGSQTPGHPPALYLGASARRLPAGDGSGPTHQGKGRGGPGGLRVGRPRFPSCKRERETQEARGSTEKKLPPSHPETRGNHGKTRQGEPTHPEKKGHESQGEGKTRQGAPHQPRRKKEIATRRRRTRRRKTKHFLGVPRLVKGVEEEAGPRQREFVLAESLWGHCPPPPSRVNTQEETKATTHNHDNPILPILSIVLMSSEKTSRRDDAPPPLRGPRKTRTRRQNKARSLKGSKNHTIFPQSTSPEQEAKTEPFMPKHP